MSKSVKRNNKYISDEVESRPMYEEQRTRLQQKKLVSALRSKNATALLQLEEEY
jgi:hypothetical protein